MDDTERDEIIEIGATKSTRLVQSNTSKSLTNYCFTLCLNSSSMIKILTCDDRTFITERALMPEDQDILGRTFGIAHTDSLINGVELHTVGPDSE